MSAKTEIRKQSRQYRWDDDYRDNKNERQRAIQNQRKNKQKRLKFEIGE